MILAQQRDTGIRGGRAHPGFSPPSALWKGGLKSALLSVTIVTLFCEPQEFAFTRVFREQLAAIEAVEPWFSDSVKIRPRGGPEVEFSRRQAQLFRESTSL